MYLNDHNGKKQYSKDSLMELENKEQTQKFDKKQLSFYAEGIKKAKLILSEKHKQLKVETDSRQINILSQIIREIEGDLRGYDLTRENETIGDFEDRKEQDRLFCLSREYVSVSERHIQGLKDSAPDQMDRFFKLNSALELGYYLGAGKKSEAYIGSLAESVEIITVTDLVVCLESMDLNETRIYFNDSSIIGEPKGRTGMRLVGFKFKKESYQSKSPLFIKEKERPIFPVLSDEEAEKKYGKNYEEYPYNDVDDVNNEEYKKNNFREVAYVDQADCIIVFMFIKNINFENIITKDISKIGFEIIIDQDIDITDIQGLLENTINIPEDLLYSIASLNEKEEVYLEIKNRVIEFKVRDQRPIRSSGKGDLSVLIDRNLIDLNEANKEQPFPFLYNMPGVGIVYTNSINGCLRIQKMSKSDITRVMSQSIDFRKGDNEFSDRDYPPAKQVEILWDLDNAKYLPEIGIVTPLPYFNRKGHLQGEEGYSVDDKTLYFNVENLDIKKVNSNPSKEEMEQAKEILRLPFSEFPFKDESSSTNFMAYIITPFIRSMIHDALMPMPVFSAAEVGTGKTLSATCGAAVYSKNFIITTPSHDNSEWKRSIISQLSTSPDFIIYDNVNTLDSEAMAATVSSRSITDRQIGTSKTMTIPNNSIFVITGNNPVLSKEIARRSYFINLDAKMENPAHGRNFKIENLRTWIENNRPELIWAILTIVQSWVSMGKPRDNSVKLVGGFEEWTVTLAGILANAGYKDFMLNKSQNHESVNPETMAWKALVLILANKYGESKKFTTSNIYEEAKDIEGLELNGKNPIDQKKSLGTALSKNCGRVYGEYQIIKAGTTHKTAVWKLEKI